MPSTLIRRTCFILRPSSWSSPGAAWIVTGIAANTIDARNKDKTLFVRIVWGISFLVGMSQGVQTIGLLGYGEVNAALRENKNRVVLPDRVYSFDASQDC